MTLACPPAAIRRAAKRLPPRDLRELLAASAELIDAHAFGDRAMAARERIARVLRRAGVYPPRSRETP